MLRGSTSFEFILYHWLDWTRRLLFGSQTHQLQRPSPSGDWIPHLLLPKFERDRVIFHLVFLMILIAGGCRRLPFVVVVVALALAVDC